MKIKDLLGEDDTLKSISGDKAVVNMGGQDQEIATKDLIPGAQPNTITIKPTDPNQLKPGMKVSTSGEQTSEEQGEEEWSHDLVAQGDHDVGGDGTDQFIRDISVHPHVKGTYEYEEEAADPNQQAQQTIGQLTAQPAPTSAPTDTDGPGYSFDSAKGFKDAISKDLGSKDPEINAQIDKLVAAEPDGTVDVDQTLYNMINVADNEIMPAMLNFVKQMIDSFTQLTKSPEWSQVSPADQASVLQSIKDMQASLPKIEQAVADAHAEFEKNKGMMQQNIKDRKMNQQLKGTPATMSEADRQMLEKMRMIAGLR